MSCDTCAFRHEAFWGQTPERAVRGSDPGPCAAVSSAAVPGRDVLRLSLADARRAAVCGQLLASPGPLDVAQVIAHLGWLQIDPTAVVERTERLVLFSRIGGYDTAELDRLLAARELFEYRAFILPSADLALHRPAMRRYPQSVSGRGARAAYVTQWLAANRAFRNHLVRRLRQDGPLPTSAIEDRAKVPWTTGGWNDGKSVSMMLEVLWAQGVVTVAGRDARERLWDLAERVLPAAQKLTPAEVARRLIDRQLKAFGVARAPEFGQAFYGRTPGFEEALRKLVAAGRVRPAVIDGVRGAWYAHAETLEAPYVPRTTVLSPFDRLIHDRRRASLLFGFDYKLEIYIPPAKRVHGYYVLPVLDGDRLVGRIDSAFDRGSSTLRVDGAWIEPGAPEGSDEAVLRAIDGLAAWLAASGVGYGPTATAALGRALGPPPTERSRSSP